MMKKFSARAVFCALVCGALLLSGCASHTHVYTQTVIEPTCSSIGYTINSCSCGETFYSDYRSKTEHTYSEWIKENDPGLVNKGDEYSYCTVCGDLRVRESQNLSALPKLYFTFGTRSEPDSLLFESKDAVFTCGASLTEENRTEKPDYSLSLFYKADRSAYNTDLGWGDQSTYRLCGQFSDPLKCRDRAGLSVWNGLQADRNETEKTPGGFPVQLYVDGIYKGVYDLLPDRSWQYRGGGSSNASVIACDGTCDFNSEPVFSRPGLGEKESGYAFLHCTGETTAWAEESFAAFCRFVQTASDKQFREHLSDHTDVSALIDYYLTAEVLCAAHRLESGTIWYTKDGKTWLPEFSDLTNSFAITEAGIPCWYAYNLPAADAHGAVVYKEKNLLWKRFVQIFLPEIENRYAVLRENVFTAEFLINAFDSENARTEAGLLEEEALLYPGTPDASRSQTVLEFLEYRFGALDKLFLPL